MSASNEMRSKLVRFSLEDGMSPDLSPIQRRLSNMKGMYADRAAYARMVRESDPLVYEFHDVGLPEKEGAIAFGTSITYAGKVGDEYFMTKGHFHTILATSEVYYCLRGHGYMLMENPEGDWEARELTPGCAVYVPERYAHRSINVGANAPLITFFAFRADAGHNYGAIETKGFRKRLVERNGKPEIIDNPGWKV
jgi:glucose-6-phosphate isomerase, archaeal